MRWTKIKKELEEKLSENLKGRLKYNITVYTKDYSGSKSANRAWITYDKTEILNISSEDFFIYNRPYRYNKTTPTYCATSELEFPNRTDGKIIENGEFSTFDFTECAYHFLNMNIDDALNHESPIINMFAILDRRTGKRRLEKLSNEDLHPLVQKFLDLRNRTEK